MKVRSPLPCVRGDWHRFGVPNQAAIEAFWNEYKLWNNAAPEAFSVCEFGDTPELSDALIDLIKRGVKTATASAYQAYLDENEAVPQAGCFVVVVDSRGDPACLYEITDVRVGFLQSVDAAFAFDEGESEGEGEGDRTREGWLEEHRRFFGLPFPGMSHEEENFRVVFERFRLVWPLNP